MKKILVMILLILSILIIPNPVSATTFDLSIPPGDLIRGQEIKFTININTEGKSLSSASIGMKYDAQYLEYISTAPGNTFTTISADLQSAGKLTISGSSAAPYSGSGVYAYVTYKLIAAGQDPTELCALINLIETPTPRVTNSPSITASLPESGESKLVIQGVALALFFLAAAGTGLFIFK